MTGVLGGTALSYRHLPVDPPVVLAPMAGVTNSAFRRLCRRYGGGLFVSEMVMARAVVEGNRKTRRMMSFAPDETVRSVQLYGSDPAFLGRAVRVLVDEIGVDHVDLNFGCPAAKVTRRGGGAAVPARPALFGALVAAAVRAAGDVPVTVKFRVGLDAERPTAVTCGRIAEDAGVSALALHARTAQQGYAGSADWSAIAELKAAVTSIPVLGNGDIWEAHDAVRMLDETGCDGVVVGRGCLGRPWLFRDLDAALTGRPVDPPPLLGTVVDVLCEHARLLVEHHGDEGAAMRDLRKHTGWYLTGYPVGPEVRRRAALVSSLGELHDVLGGLDRSIRLPAGGERLARGHTGGGRPVPLPAGWLDAPDDTTPPGDDDGAFSGG